MSVEAVTPAIDTGTKENTCQQVTTATATANVELAASQVLIKCLTQPSYIRFGANGVEVTTSNGYYMAIGDEIRVQLIKGASFLAYIRAGASDGALSIMPIEAD